MTNAKTVYLAGPEVFVRNPLPLFRRKMKYCEEFGFTANMPKDNRAENTAGQTPTDRSREIYLANVELMKTSDFGVFDLTPFRGPSADVGTTFELGFMTALGKPVFAYTNILGDYIDRIAPRQHRRGSVAMWQDAEGWSIEDYGNADNLMIDSAVAGSVGPLMRFGPSLSSRLKNQLGFRECLRRARDYFDAET